jgi:phenylalanyl-tRNA synthetase beta chain
MAQAVGAFMACAALIILSGATGWFERVMNRIPMAIASALLAGVLARFGMVHPATLKAFDADGPIAAVELFLDAIPARKGAAFARAQFTPPALQAVTRDFAFLVPASLAAGDLVRAVQGADKAFITGVRVFDVFAGQGVPEGKKSIALEVTLQPGEASFKDAELKAIAEKVVAAAAKLGGELRG